MSCKGSLVVVGSGPGVGQTTAAHFARQGFKHVVLLSRDESRLAEDSKAVQSAAPGVKVDFVAIDVSADEAMIKQVLSNVDAILKAAGSPLEVLLYNAARVGPSNFMEWDAGDLEKDLKITTVNLYVALQWAIPQLLETARSAEYNPAVLVTSGLLYREPFPFLFSLSAGKAAQHNLMNSIHQKYEPRIHAACLPIGGFIGDQSKVTTSQRVAEEFWKLYQQPKGHSGQMSVELEDPDYYDGVEGSRKAVEGQ